MGESSSIPNRSLLCFNADKNHLSHVQLEHDVTGDGDLRAQRRGGGIRTAALMRFHALMVTAMAITCPSSRSVNAAAARS